MGKQKFIIFYFLLISALLAFSIVCQKNENAPKIEAKTILIGAITEQQLQDLSPAYADGKNTYQPDSASISFLHEIITDVNIVVFLGTWCPDSQRELPHFLKVIEETRNNHFTFQMIGVDRSKRDSLGLAEKYQIEFVPTFILIQNGHELGRIVETPMLSFEQDLAEVLSVIN